MRDPAPGMAHLIGDTIRLTRQAARLSERELARRLGTNQRAIQRLELGVQRHLDADLATSAMQMLGIRFSVDANAPGLAGRAEQRDAVHAWCVAAVCRHLQRRGWETRIEVEIGNGRGRGWIDVLAFRGADGSLLVIEVKTVVDDLGRIVRNLGWHTRHARDAGAALGWPVRRVVRALFVLVTADCEARLELHSDPIALEFPDLGSKLGVWLETPGAALPQSSIALLDPRRRRRPWLLPTRSEGRRTPSPYRDYADAARALTRPRARPR